MAGQSISVRRMIVTNILIAAMIAVVCYLSFHGDVLEGLSRAVNAPVFAGGEGACGVALEIALCAEDDAHECMDVLREEGARATLFACPALLEKEAGLLESMEKAGFEAGVYDCGKHALKGAIPEGRLLLSDYASELNLFAAFSEGRRVYWTLDADLLFAADDTGENLADAVHENGIVLYRYQNGGRDLKKLIRIIRVKGYNITDVKSITSSAP